MKRIRTEPTRTNNKFSITITEAIIGRPQRNIRLFKATQPVTLTGIEWAFTFGEEIGTTLSASKVFYLLATNGDREGPHDINTDDTGDNFIDNAGQVITSGGVYLGPRDHQTIIGKSTWMRKMKEGDEFTVSFKNAAVLLATCSCVGTVTFFAMF